MSMSLAILSLRALGGSLALVSVVAMLVISLWCFSRMVERPIVICSGRLKCRR